jgi:hypothetical protein
MNILVYTQKFVTSRLKKRLFYERYSTEGENTLYIKNGGIKQKRIKESVLGKIK